MSKRAVLIGCNYPGTKAELKGCINDVRRMQRCLVERYGFPAEHIGVLVDTEGGAEAQPTGKNIRAALSDLVSSARPGDILFVHYSGHGTRLPAETDHTGYDECIVPTDMNLITDDDLRELVNKVADGCRMTIVSDSCHSGGLIDEAKEQIGESTTRNKSSKCSAAALLKKLVCASAEQQQQQQQQSKSLPLSTLIEILKQKTGRHDIKAEAGELRPALLDIFGNDATPTPKINKFIKAMVRKFHDEDVGIIKRDNGILISGCQSDETSADTIPDGDATKAYGALSNAIQEIVAETPGRLSNRNLVVRARKLLKKQGFTQHPGLYCTHQYLHAPFIC